MGEEAQEDPRNGTASLGLVLLGCFFCVSLVCCIEFFTRQSDKSHVPERGLPVTKWSLSNRLSGGTKRARLQDEPVVVQMAAVAPPGMGGARA